MLVRPSIEALLFVEPASAREPGTLVSIRDVARGRYLQYRAYLESERSDQSPAFEAVTLHIEP